MAVYTVILSNNGAHSKQIKRLPQSKKMHVPRHRFMNSAAIEVEFDKQGRVNIHKRYAYVD